MIYHVKRYTAIVAIVILMLVGIWIMHNNDSPNSSSEIDFIEQMELIEESDKNEEVESKVIVDIKGEVQKPGVYEVESNSRVTNIISLAGGFTNNADQQQINLAQKVYDEMVIIVPREGEELTNLTSSTTSTNNGVNNDGSIKINHATKDEIETLNGIGPTKAQAIIDYREEHGRFQKVEDLLQVNGIGEKTLDNIRDNIIIP